MIHWKFIRRELTTATQQSLIFVLCVALALVTLTGLNSFGESVNKALLNDARKLQAGDIIIDSPQSLSGGLASAVDQLVRDRAAEATLVRRLFTVARAGMVDASLLAELKIIQPAYPFYGVVELASGRQLDQVLTAGTVIVEQLVLDRLQLAVGDTVALGEASLTIGDVLVRDPVRPVNFFAFGPRILVAESDLEKLKLILPGSRVRYRTLLKISKPSELQTIAGQLRVAADGDIQRVRTYRSAQSGIQRFFNNLLFFLNLVAVFIVLLAGIGIQSAVTAFLRERDNTIAVIKTLGATNRFVTVHFLLVLMVLATVGTVLGVVGGLVLQKLFPILLDDFLPSDVTLSLSWRVVAESVLLSVVVVGIFAFLPLDRLKQMRPSYILRKEMIPVPRNFMFYVVLAILIAGFATMVLWQLNHFVRSLMFVGGALLLVVIIAIVTQAVLFVLRRLPIRRLDLRQALRGLFRPRNATRAVIVTLASSLCVVFTIYLVEQNLDSAFVRSYPEDTPNVVFIDIQPAQRAAFRDTIGAEVGNVLEEDPVFFPVVRGHIQSINGQAIDRDTERKRKGDNLARQFNLTYRNEMLESEELIEGDSMFDAENPDLQVSLLDDLLEMRDFKVGDTIMMRILGIPIEATVSSIRRRTSESISPFFYFVFSPQALEKAPHTIFTALHVPSEKIAALQNRVAAKFPNVSVIDVTQAVAALVEVARKLSLVIRLLAAFSIAAGLLIVVSSVYATRFARIQEAVYFKVLGANSRFVVRVFAIENMILGLISVLLALVLAQLSGWALCHWIFDIRFQPYLSESFGLILVTMLLVMAVGMAASVTILRKRPIVFLREQSQE